MIKWAYLCVVCGMSVLACTIFGIVATATWIQDPQDITIRKHITFRVDNTFSLEEQKAIGAALHKWEKATAGFVTLNWYTDKTSIREIFTWQEDRIPTIYNASSNLSWKRYVSQYITTTTSNDLLGVAFYLTGDIFIVDDMPKRFEVVVTHEIGHILIELRHSNNINSVMYPYIGLNFANKKITKEEVFWVRQLRR